MYELKDSNDNVIATGETVTFGDNSVAVGGLTLRGTSNVHLFKDGVEVSVADAQADQESDYDNWTLKERSFIKLLVKQINNLRGLHGESPFTKAQVISALKAER